MTQEQVEREWFKKVATILLLAALTVGVVPILKNTFFPVARANR